MNNLQFIVADENQCRERLGRENNAPAQTLESQVRSACSRIYSKIPTRARAWQFIRQYIADCTAGAVVLNPSTAFVETAVACMTYENSVNARILGLKIGY